MEATTEKAVCRGCNRTLIGKPYYTGQPAYHPDTNERCKVNYYGGFVCSERCDWRSSIEQESSFPGAGNAKRLSSGAMISYNTNWN